MGPASFACRGDEASRHPPSPLGGSGSPPAPVAPEAAAAEAAAVAPVVESPAEASGGHGRSLRGKRPKASGARAEAAAARRPVCRCQGRGGDMRQANHLGAAGRRRGVGRGGGTEKHRAGHRALRQTATDCPGDGLKRVRSTSWLLLRSFW